MKLPFIFMQETNFVKEEQEPGLVSWHHMLVRAVKCELIMKRDIECIINIMEEPFNATLMDSDPAHETEEQAPEMIRGVIPEDCTVINVVIPVNQGSLSYLPMQVHWEPPVCFRCIRFP